MTGKPLSERRQFRRYIVSGEVSLFRGQLQGTAKLIQLGMGGMLIRGGSVLPKGSRAVARIRPEKYPYEIELPLEVVEVRNALMGVRFLAKSDALIDFRKWLQRENYLAAPMYNPSETIELPTKNNCVTSFPRFSNVKDRAAAIEFMMQQ